MDIKHGILAVYVCVGVLGVSGVADAGAGSAIAHLQKKLVTAQADAEERIDNCRSGACRDRAEEKHEEVTDNLEAIRATVDALKKKVRDEYEEVCEQIDCDEPA